MKRSFLFKMLGALCVFLFCSCGVDLEQKDTDREKYSVSFYLQTSQY